VQIGHGIFACNFSTDYDWPDFEAFVVEQMHRLQAAHPKSELALLQPVRIELRYVDIFNCELLNHNSFTRFLWRDTKTRFEGLEFLQGNRFAGDDAGMLRLRRGLADPELGWFQLETASAQSDGAPAIILTSRVTKEMEPAEWSADPISKSKVWLAAAHSVTSDFFRSFVGDELMAKFKQGKK
jgi:uncharacterized protein (TIGR04255 family)